jgi:MerR family transcriptional regulator, thiopeptide resistance regulator
VIEILTIDEVVRRTGLTSRALRFYEARGLIKPLRTASGKRLFGAGELARVHQIVTLKKAGFSLTQIGLLLDRKAIDLGMLFRNQIDNLTTQAREIEIAQTSLKSALSRIESGEPLDAETLCSLIRDGDRIMAEGKWKKVIDRFYTAEEQEHWRQQLMPSFSEINQQEYNDKWRILSNRIEAELPLDPTSSPALAFVREWFTLLEPFSRVATQEMWQSSQQFYEKMPQWESEVDPGFSSTVWKFIRQATDAARDAGHDIGPVPEFMKAGRSN